MNVWTQFLNDLERIIGKKAVARWLRPLRLTSFDARNLYLDADDPFQIHWFFEQVDAQLLSRLQAPSGASIKLHFSVKGRPFDRLQKKSASHTERPATPFKSSHLDPHALLEHFWTDDTPHFPLQVIKEWLKQPAPLSLSDDNPLYLYGPLGSGKTHLLMGIAHALKAKGLRPFYIQAQTFVEHVVHAFRSSLLHSFRALYRSIDVLLIDDVHLLARKTGTQEEFFHTFNHLYEEKRPIVMTAHCPAQKLEEIEERLISRFEWGLALSCPAPSKALKKILIRKRSHQFGITLEPSAYDFLLTTFHPLPTLIRSIEALALRGQHLLHTPMTKATLVTLLQDLIAAENAHILSPEVIIESVARYFDLTSKDILSRSQRKECTLPRQIAMYLCRNNLSLPYIKIGKLFFRDHSTVMSSTKLIAQALQNKEPLVTQSLQAILLHLSNRP